MYRKPIIGLLPLYLELYDKLGGERRIRLNEFYDAIAVELQSKGIDVLKAPICRLKPEFDDTVARFERLDADAIVTLHLTYSPSLESIDALASTGLPLIVLNTTPTFEFDQFQSPVEIGYNHGIHGVQDMCNLLQRRGKKYFIETGYRKESDVMDRASVLIKAARLAKYMKRMKAGRIGGSFKGMGDFCVQDDVLLKEIGIRTVEFDFEQMNGLVAGIAEAEIIKEKDENALLFDTNFSDQEAYSGSIKTCLAVRHWMEKEELGAFSFNFLAIDKESGFPAAPFLEASKAMARGIGYAGEGDVLTAALVGTLLQAYPETTFTEMFCADWRNNNIFLSHMAEMNINLTDSKPELIDMDYPFTDAGNPVVAVGRLNGGKAVVVNLSPCRGGSFRLIVSPVDMLEINGRDEFEHTVRGWFKPHIPVDEFLTAFSKAGGTHHSALVYGDFSDEIVKFGEMMNWDVVRI